MTKFAGLRAKICGEKLEPWCRGMERHLPDGWEVEVEDGPYKLDNGGRYYVVRAVVLPPSADTYRRVSWNVNEANLDVSPVLELLCH
jgi:hypothetical protein